MPFDGSNTQSPAMRRAILIDALNGDMPKGFTWDFTQIWNACDSSGCALGLASLIWPEHAVMLRFGHCAEVGKFFGLSYYSVNDVFFGSNKCYRAAGRPRPKTVAKALAKQVPVEE